MDPRAYLALARQLVADAAAGRPLTGGTGAAECRCAISRAYYGAYNIAVDFRGRVGFETTSQSNCHTAVQYALNQSGSAALKTVSTFLNTLYGERRVADYELWNPRAEGKNQADAMVKLAERAAALVGEVERDPAEWGAIATAVLGYIEASKTTALRRKAPRGGRPS